MKYMVLLVDGEDWTQMTPEQRASEMAKHAAFDEAVAARADCEILGGEALDEASVTLARTNAAGKIELTDGPFAEATEGIGGYYVVDAPDLDTLAELLEVLPDYVMEIRPVASPGDMVA